MFGKAKIIWACLKQSKFHLFISFMHGIFMMLLTFLWLGFFSSGEYELSAYKDSTEKKSLITSNEKRKDKYLKQFLFLDTSQTLEIYDDGFASPARTNRTEILKTLDILCANKDHFSILLLDVFFDSPNKEDEFLLNKIQQRVNYLDKYHKIITTDKVEYVKEQEVFLNHIRSSQTGIAVYEPTEGESFYSFKYSQKIKSEYRKQTALLCTERYKKSLANEPFLGDILYTYNNRNGIYQNNVVPEIILTRNDLRQDDEYMNGYYKYQNFYRLNEFNEKCDNAFKHFGKPTIVIGNYVDDKHYTANGHVPGPLLVTNAIIALADDCNKISIWYILFMFITYVILSYLTIYYLPYETEKRSSVTDKGMLVFFGSELKSLLISNLNLWLLWLISIVGLYFFGYYVFVMFNTAYLVVINFLARAIAHYRQQKREL